MLPGLLCQRAILSLLGNVPPLQFRDSINEKHKESVPEHIKDIKSINQKLFNSFDEKIKNVSKSAIDIARETTAHMHHSTNKSEENCYELLGELASYKAVLASPEHVQSC